MTDQKDRPVAGKFQQQQDSTAASRAYQQALTEGHTRRLPTEGQDLRGWEAYRRWLGRMQAPAGKRNGADPALYTWKGYRSWADRVRRSWSSED